MNSKEVDAKVAREEQVISEENEGRKTYEWTLTWSWRNKDNYIKASLNI